MMKNLGYPRNFAGAVEAVASNGGLIMPPVMGTVAFLIVEMLGMSYIAVCLAAALPAVLYYTVLLFSVHFHSKRMGLQGIPSNQLPSLWRVIKGGWPFIIPLVVLIWLLVFMNNDPQKACFWAIISLVAVSLFRKETRLGPKKLLIAVEQLLPTMSMMGVAASSGAVIMASLSLTGFGIRFSSILTSIAGDNLLLLLVIGAIASFILGMGSGMMACYIIVAVIVVPAVVDLGVIPIAAHLFAFWWAIASFITPPVCVNAYIAAGFAGGDPMKTGWMATRLGIASYILPFLFCLYPALILQGPLVELPQVIISTLLGSCLLASGLSGYLLMPMSWTQRILVLIGSGLLFVQGPIWVLPRILVDVIGLVIGIGMLLWQYRIKNRQKQAGIIT